MKIRILKNYAAGKAGEIINANFPGGDEQEYIDNGYIEIIEEDKPLIKKTIKKKTIEKKPREKEKTKESPSLSVKEIQKITNGKNKLNSPQETVGSTPKEFIELESGKIMKKSDYEKRKMIGEWAMAQSMLNEFFPIDYSRETYERVKDNGILHGALSWETFDRWGKEHPLETKEEINLPKVKIGGSGILISSISNNVGKIYENNRTLFYKEEIKEIVEVSKIKHNEDNKSFMGFTIIKPKRFITLSEKYFIPWVYNLKKDENGDMYKEETPTSLTNNKADIILASPQFQEKMPIIKRIFTVQMPIIYNNKLTFPCNEYDERFFSWLPYDSPTISNLNMTLEDAKEIIKTLFKEFCFENKQDFTNAVSALLTPFLQGIYKTGFNTRTPVYCYEANRERSGKDYLAGVTGIVYEGCALEEPPISSGERGASGSNDELRKKITSALISGRRRLHFSNNKGHLNNSVFEGATTATKYSDRLLGKNEIVTLDNELCFSFSGNLGITLTPDLTNRTIFISLFLDIEDANKRKFDNPNLHKWVLENRNNILSALYSLVKNWFDNGMINGSMPFASYPEWARVCGGIMEAAGYDNPCKRGDQHIGISIDKSTDEMKEVFELCYTKHPDIWLNKSEIRSIIKNDGGDIMHYVDWMDHSAQIKFGNKLNKFIGRILSGVRLVVENRKIRSSRWKYKFVKNNRKTEIFGWKNE